MATFFHRLGSRHLPIKRPAACDLRRRRLWLQKAGSAGPGPETSPEPGPGAAVGAEQQTVGPVSSWLPLTRLHASGSSLSFLSSCLAGMQRARCPTILVLVAFVLCSPGVSPQPDRDQDQYQDLDLELQRARTAGLLSQVRYSATNENPATPAPRGRPGSGP